MKFPSWALRVSLAVLVLLCCVSGAAAAEGPGGDEGWVVEEAEPEIGEESEPEDDTSRQKEALRTFAPYLDPYGRWVLDPAYGRVWVPHRSVVGAAFSPYVTGGRWALTPNDEWLWVSDYPFGRVAFHYGRWAWTSDMGWAWVPGYVYSPAWVRFRVGAAGYLGWGPLPPRRIWRGGLFVSAGFTPWYGYVYCPSRFVFAGSLRRHVIRNRIRARRVARQSRGYRARRRASSGRYLSGPRPLRVGLRASDLPRRRVRASRALAASRAARVRSKPRAGAQRGRAPAAGASRSARAGADRQRAPATKAKPRRSSETGAKPKPRRAKRKNEAKARKRETRKNEAKARKRETRKKKSTTTTKRSRSSGEARKSPERRKSSRASPRRAKSGASRPGRRSSPRRSAPARGGRNRR